ncbi:unnamed protein product [Soboliphyme baturini]|uniref:dUTPase domain-containing protein n=1 Tax=Soboliphyme baturini TaxID=241478 RepID=A0A183IFK0_9BILA|nr:unnamed protein product [Soboliphyme baturini]
MHAQTGDGVLVEPSLEERITDLNPVSGGEVIRRLKLQQAKAFTLEIQCALYEVPNTESLILMNDFNAKSEYTLKSGTA